MSEGGQHRKLAQYDWVDAAPSTKAGAPPPPSISCSTQVKEVAGAAMACSERKAYLMGGYDPRTQQQLQQVVEWDLHTRQWGRQPDMPEKLSQASAAAYEDHCFLWGGWNGDSFSHNLWVLKPKREVGADGQPAPPPPPPTTSKQKEAATSCALHWECLPPRGTAVERPIPSPSARCGHALVLGTHSSPPGGGADDASNNNNNNNSNGLAGTSTTGPEPVLYLFGGFDGSRRLNDVWRLWIRASLMSREAVWERVEHHMGIPPAPRDDAAVAFSAAQEKLYVFGGYASTLMNDLHVLDLKDGRNQWMPIQAALGTPTRRQGAIASVDAHHLIICSGTGEDQECLPQLIQLNLTDLKWSTVAVDHCQDLMSGRRGFMGCCGDRGRRILMYGGGRLPQYLTSMVEVELERIDSSSKKK